jgi:uncharacterized membrane protein
MRQQDTMTARDALDEPALFSASLTPHRSLGVQGFTILLALLGLISVVAGIVFLVIGAWPVTGFFGLDVLAIYIAFRINYARAAASEDYAMTPSDLRVRRTSHRGEVAQWHFNPLWVRLHKDTHEEFGVQRLSLVSRGKHLIIANFLGPQEKESFAQALSAALGAARRGVSPPDRPSRPPSNPH